MMILQALWEAAGPVGGRRVPSLVPHSVFIPPTKWSVMKSPLLPILITAIIVGGLFVGLSFLPEPEHRPDNTETFYYTISAEDVRGEGIGGWTYSTIIRLTLDHAPAAALYVWLDLGFPDGSLRGFVISGTSDYFELPISLWDPNWEEGKTWTDPAWSASYAPSLDYPYPVPVVLIKTQTVNV